MRWTPGGVSGNVEDRRGSSGGMGFGGGGGVRLGLGGFIIVAVLSLVFKTNFFSLLGGGGGGHGQRKLAQRDAKPSTQRS
jgi:predicted metalloprotease